MTGHVDEAYARGYRDGGNAERIRWQRLMARLLEILRGGQ